MANIRIPQYERKVQLNANQSPAVRLAEPIPAPDYGKAIQQAGAAIASIGSSVNAIGNRLQQQNFALIEAEYDNAVQQALTTVPTTNTEQPEWDRTARGNFNKTLDTAKDALRKKYPSYFTDWEKSSRGKIAEIKTQQAVGKVIDSLMYNKEISNLNTLLEDKITKVLLTGEDVSGKAFDDQLEQIISPYSGFLTEQDRQRERNKAAARAYGLYIDKKIQTGLSKDVKDLIKNLKQQKIGKDGKGTGEPEYFRYMTAEDRAKYIHLLERNVKARKDTIFESNAEIFLEKFNAAIESGEEIEVPFTDAEGGTVYQKDMSQIPPVIASGNIAGMTGKEILEGGRIPVKTKMSKAAAMLDYAVKHRRTFAKENNISPKQINSIISYMRQAINDSPVGMKAITDFEAFKVKYNEAYDGGDKTSMTRWGSLYATLLTADERGWTANKGMRDKVYQMKTAIELEAARLVKDDEVKSEYKKGWYNFFGTKTNDEYVKDNVENWIRTVANYAYDEAIPAELTGQAYLWAYSYMSTAGWSAYARAGVEEKEALSKAVVDYLRKQVRAEYPGMPDGATVNITNYR